MLILIQLPAAASGPAQNVTISITDKGFSPITAAVTANGSVTWVNAGSSIHTATTNGNNNPLPFDSGGLAAGQSSSMMFTTPGTYTYTSTTDCINGNNSPTFNCGVFYTITVSSGPIAQPTAAPTIAPAPVVPTPAPSAPTPLAAPAPTLAAQPVIVTITDAGISPESLTVALNGIVTFANNGSGVHTASTTGSNNPTPFDTGGIAQGQSLSLTFATPGTFTYTSATDCLNNNSNPGFKCGPYTIVVPSPPARAANTSAVLGGGSNLPTRTADVLAALAGGLGTTIV